MVDKKIKNKKIKKRYQKLQSLIQNRTRQSARERRILLNEKLNININIITSSSSGSSPGDG